jgi:tryptophan-rich sensory protein
VRAAALPVAALPVATYLASLVPWETTAQPRWVLLASVVGADLLVAAVAGLGPWRRRPLGPPIAILAITTITLVADVVTGSHLELDGLLGYDAIVAGRFIGYGNLTFSLLLTGGLLLTAAVATAAGRRFPASARLTTAGVTLLLGVVVIVLDGAPQLGRDFGGVLSAVPSFLLLAMLLVGARVSIARLGAILGAAVVVVGTVAVLDWLRPADQRTHLGRFVQQLIDGDAWTVVSRKAGANLGILTGSPLAWMVPVILVAAVWLVRPGGLLRGGRSGLAPSDAAVLRAGLLAVGLGQLIGTALNDSGVALPATAAGMLIPLLVWLAAAPWTTRPASSPGAGDHPGSGPVEDPDRVTVGSRGSTVWHA